MKTNDPKSENKEAKKAASMTIEVESQAVKGNDTVAPTAAIVLSRHRDDAALAAPLAQVVELDEVRAAEWRTRVRACMEDMSERAWELGQCLHVLWRDDKFVRSWGFKDWDDWVERELGLELRRAQYYRRTFEYFAVENKIDPGTEARLRRLAWTKARMLVGKVKPEEVGTWVKYAETHSREELGNKLKEVNVNNRNGEELDPTEVFRRLSFALAHTEGDDASQFALVEAALARARQIAGSDKQGHLLTLICQEFLATNDFTGDKNLDRAKFWAKYEALYGKKLVIVNNDTGEIEYGLLTLKNLAEGGEGDTREE